MVILGHIMQRKIVHPRQKFRSRNYGSQKSNKFSWQYIFQTLIIFRRSLIFQTKEFFENSTLHGVRYITENGRPAAERFMWFCFTATGAIAALVIIMSLWEKFQTNPTITGLDTDFYNENVEFPTVVICPTEAYDDGKIIKLANELLGQNSETLLDEIIVLLKYLTALNFLSVKDFYEVGKSLPAELMGDKKLRELAFNTSINCEDVLLNCNYRDATLEECCDDFSPIYTEHGFCYAFNSRFKSDATADVTTDTPHDLYETDKKWALFFQPNVTAKIFIFSNEEYFGVDFNAQVDYIEGQNAEVRISKKETFTTEDARQLSIDQRKCIFFDEVTLSYFPDSYTFSSCMKECRMKLSIKFCKCNPPFYKPIADVNSCSIGEFSCLIKYRPNITDIRSCMHCELSCTKSVFNVEKLTKTSDGMEKTGVLVEFLTWPIIRYKREVLFGWVDLLVSFGGIASLFLGFSLLSAVEIIYYFTLRACCMVYQKREELYELEEEIRRRPPPYVDLSLKLYYHNLRRPSIHEKLLLDKKEMWKYSSKNKNSYRNEKALQLFSRSRFRQTKVSPLLLNNTSRKEYECGLGPYLP